MTVRGRTSVMTPGYRVPGVVRTCPGPDAGIGPMADDNE